MWDISDEHWDTLQRIGYYLLGGLFIWYLFIGYDREFAFEGEGQVNAFPVDAESKNYRLPADIYVETNGRTPWSNYDEYTVLRATWPNGGTLTFSEECIVKGPQSTTVCTTEDGDAYTIEVETPPEKSADTQYDDQ
jgi:hypothetical protein